MSTHVFGLTVDLIEHASRAARTVDHAVTLVDDATRTIVVIDQQGRVTHLIPSAIDVTARKLVWPCRAAGGLYRFGCAVPGRALVGRRFWPGQRLPSPAGQASGWTPVGATAVPTAVSVVIRGPTGAKIACADLS